MHKLGYIWGLLLLSQDLLNYYMYILLVTSVPKYVTCDNFLEYYIKFSLISTILANFCYAVSGLLIDYYSKKLLILLVGLNIFGMVIFSIMALPYLFIENIYIYEYSIVILCIGWLLQQSISIFINNIYWKILKQNVESKSIQQDDCFNNYTKLGNTGDITCNISELTIFGVLLGIIYIKNIEINIILLYFFMVLCIVYILLLILIVKLVDYDHNLLNNIFYTTPTFTEKFRYLYHNTKVFNTLIHAFILLLFTAIAQYPLTMHEVNVVNNLDGICNGKLNNIFILALLMSMFYLIGSITYRLFIVNMKNVIFYRWVYPFCLLGIILLFPLWMTKYPFFIFISVCISQVIPYYLNYYNYYVITNYIDESYYGFVLGIYGIMNTLLILMGQGLFLTNININIIIVFGSILLIISMICAFRLSRVLNNDNI